MAETATLYRVRLDLSNLDEDVYRTLDFRIAQHPSEDGPRLVARILAYGLLHEEGLEFGRGLSTADDAALWTHDLTGRLVHWIDVGVPSAERIHSASKAAQRVSVFCHKPEEALRRELRGKSVFAAERVEFLLVSPQFVTQAAEKLERSVEWSLMVTGGELHLTIGQTTLVGSLERRTLLQLKEAHG